MELKIGTPVILVTKCKDGTYTNSPLYDSYYYLGQKVIGSFYGEPWHKILPTRKLKTNDDLHLYLVPAKEWDNFKLTDISKYSIDNITDADTIDTCGIEYWQSIKSEIEEFYNY